MASRFVSGVPVLRSGNYTVSQAAGGGPQSRLKENTANIARAESGNRQPNKIDCLELRNSQKRPSNI